MSEVAAHPRLDSLCSTLQSLEAYPLPKETRAVIQEAVQFLDRLAQSPDPNQQQALPAGLETWDRIDRELNDSLDLEQVVETCRRWALEGTASHAFHLHLFQDGARPTGEERAADETEKPLREGEFSGEPFAAKAFLDNQQLAQVEAGFALQVSPNAGDPACLAVPLRRAGRTSGLLLVARAAPYGEIEKLFLERLALRAGTAIENARLSQSLKHANQARAKFVSVVTHELRIPMTSIKGYADLMRQGLVGPLTDQQEQFLDVIRKNVERMSALVSDLADISRFESGRISLECSSIPAIKYVDESIHSLLPKFEEKGQSLQVNVQPGLPNVMADPNRVMQILNNLLSNACKYTRPGGRVNVSLSVDGASVRLAVRDTGLGICEEDLSKVFTQFFRSESAEVREQDGWGLGLSVTRQLVELMGGTIGVESVLGQGSTFWFTLPVAES